MLKTVDVTGCDVIGQGKNGAIYRLNDETIVKVFLRDLDIDDVIRERFNSKAAFVAGIPTAISFGFASVDGHPSLLFELINGDTLDGTIAKDASCLEKYISQYAAAVRTVHDLSEEQAFKITEEDGMKDFLHRIDRLKPYLSGEEWAKVQELISGFSKKKGLIHGDPHPGNLMVAKDELLFIDLDTVSLGPAELDLITLCRTLVSFIGVEPKKFSKVSGENCKLIFSRFMDEYCKDMTESEKAKLEYICKVFGLSLVVSYISKHPEQFPSGVFEQQVNLLKDYLKETY